jgi:hypothetical protein
VSLPVVYRSTDASAPVLTGSNGDLVALLDACLRTGYGTQPGAGWTKPFTAANKAVFKQGGGNGFYLNVQDGGPGAGGAKEARTWGYVVATAQDTGTGQFPTAAQLAAGIIVRKSASADATVRQWALVADDRTFYLFVQTGDSAGVYLAFAFGDLYSYLSGDGYRTLIVGRATENSAVVTNDTLDVLEGAGAAPGALTGHYFARGYTQLGGSVNFGKHGDGNLAAGSNALNGVMPFPNPTDGGIYISRVYIVDPTTTPVRSRRGYLRGFYHWVHPIAGVIDGDTFIGVPGSEYDGRSFLLFKTSGNSGVYCIETTNWDTSA